MALCASLSFARFLASCSGVRLATPRDVADPVLRLLFAWPRDDGVVASVGDVRFRSLDPGADIGSVGSVSHSPLPGAHGQARYPMNERNCATVLGTRIEIVMCRSML